MQFEWKSKDSLSFELYEEVFENKSAEFFIWLESDNREVSLSDIRTGNAEYRFNNFVIKENRSSNTITFCPNIAGCPAYFRIKTVEPFRMSITRKDGTSSVGSAFRAGETKLELDPISIRVYKVSVTSETLKTEQSVKEEDIPDFFGGTSDRDIPTVNITQTADIFKSDSKFSVENTESSSQDAAAIFVDMFPAFGKNLKREVSVEQNYSDNSEQADSVEQSSTNFEYNSENPEEVVSVEQTHFEYLDDNSKEADIEIPDITENNAREILRDNDITTNEATNSKEPHNKSAQLSDSRNFPEFLHREYNKDYSEFQAEIDEIKERYAIDKSILEYYKDKDPVSIEELLRQTDEMINRVEEQIRLFVAAQQNKTDEIEKALKVGKKE